MLFLDLLNDAPATHFYSDLAAVFGAQLPPYQKAKVICAHLKLFLNSRSFGLSEARCERISATEYSVPFPIEVKLKIKDITAYGAELRNTMVLTVGSPSHFSKGSRHSIIIEGAEELFRRQPELKNLCQTCAEKIFQSLDEFERTPTVETINPDIPLKNVPWLHPHGRGFVCWRPMAEAFELLEREFARDTAERFKLRWVWISNGNHPKTRHPFIFLSAHDTDAPTVLNAEGSEGLIHHILQDKCPEVVWNYTQSHLWQLTKAARDDFASKAKAEYFPHLMYLPMLEMDRLAAQIIFGPNDNLPKLFSAGSRLVTLGPIALLSGFQEMVSKSVADLFSGFPSSCFNRPDLAPAIRDLLQFIIDSCPIPKMQIQGTTIKTLSFVPMSPDCPIAKTFAEYGNKAIGQAIQAEQTRAQTESLRRLGSTMMTVVHTHKRPLQHMNAFVSEIANIVDLPTAIARRTSDMRQYLEQASVFVNLDIEAHKAIFKRYGVVVNDYKELTFGTTKAEDILSMYKNCGYISDPSIFHRDPIVSGNVVNAIDPIRGQKLTIRWERGITYRTASGPLALVLAELVDNAAKYLSDVHEFRNSASVEVRFDPSKIVVANDIALGDKERVSLVLKDASANFGGSLNRAMEWGSLAGFRVSSSFPTATRLEFTIDFL